jgi:hypothetical protein
LNGMYPKKYKKTPINSMCRCLNKQFRLITAVSSEIVF